MGKSCWYNDYMNSDTALSIGSVLRSVIEEDFTLTVVAVNEDGTYVGNVCRNGACVMVLRKFTKDEDWEVVGA